MKGFTKRRWHGIPLGIVAILLVLILSGIGVLAAFNVFMGNTNVTIVESITVTNTTGDDGESFTGTAYAGDWTVSVYPGETKILNVLVSNASPNDVIIGASLPVGLSGVTATWSGPTTVPGNGSVTLTLTLVVDSDAGPGGPLTIPFAIFRV